MTPASPMIEIDCTNRQSRVTIDDQPLCAAVAMILNDAGVRTGAVSLAVVDDPTMHELNRRHLEHDYPTDVLSFLFDHNDDHLEGEIIVSVDTAQSAARDLGAAWTDELLLYVIHGALHLIGHDDHEESDRQAMRAAESHYLSALGAPSEFGPQNS